MFYNYLKERITMNKKQNLLAIALSASFVLAGANVAEANEQVQTENVSQVIDNKAQSEEKNSGLSENQDKIAPDIKADQVVEQETAKKEEESAQTRSASQGAPLGNEDQTTNVHEAANIKEDGPAEEEKIEISEQDEKEAVGEEAPAEAKKPSEDEVNKLKEAAKRSYPDAKSVEVDPKTGIIKVTRTVKEKNGDKEVDVEKIETINPYTAAGDEKLIKDYDASNRYKQTDLQPGDTKQELDKTDEKDNDGKRVEKDGFKFQTSNPSDDTPSKTQYGYQITIDKKTGQRTYTKIIVTDSGLIQVDPGDKPMMGQGDKLTAESPDVTYEPNEDVKLTASRRQRNLNYEAGEDTLKHINKKDNDSTSFGMKDNYTKDNPKPQFFGDNFGITYKVNPWPNENDKLEELKLNKKDYKDTDRYFVQGQDIDTGIKVDNLDDNAKERIVGEVYNPTTGKIVPGAKAYIGADDKIHIQMPEGALNKVNGKYVVNEGSIFNTKEYKGIQHLDVKFFARPRTKGEFENVANSGGEYDKGTYVETGAGTAEIDHAGKKVTIDKQGIDRYDHYNKIGEFQLNLDDTRYYDQDFQDKDNNKIEEHDSTNVYPGQSYTVEILDPTKTGGIKKTAGEMDDAYKAGQASGKLKEEFLKIANEKIAKDLGISYEDLMKEENKSKRWVIKGDSTNISKFEIVAPEQAVAGDFLALPVEYTYTNGSTDSHWFHFVVKDTNNSKPEYLAQVGPQGDTLVNKPKISDKEEDLKKNQPKSYELVDKTFKDDKGNKWNVSINPTSGEVTATLPLGKEINGGEKLTVPVKVKYTDKDTGIEKTETVHAQFIATKIFKTNTNETKISEIPFETKYEYNPNLAAGTVNEKQKGEKGELTITFKQDTLNGKKGIFDESGNFVEGENKIDAKVTKEAKPRIIEIGTMTKKIQLPPNKTIEIPYGVEYELDENLEKGKEEVTEGQKGEITVTVTQDETGNLTISSTQTKAPENKKVKIGTKTTGTETIKEDIPFEVEVKKDPSLKKGQWKYDKDDAGNELKGEKGEQEKTLTIVNSKVTKTSDPKVTKQPKKAVILVGDEDFTGTVKNIVTKEIPYTVKVVENPNLDAGKSNIKQQGKTGSRTYEYTGEVVNGALKDGTKFVEKEVEDSYKEPVEHIIEIGTKPTENMCPVNPEKPQEPEKPVTPEEPAPESPEVPETPDVPETPEEETPSDTETPGETPENSDDPGEENPQKPGEDKPNEPGNPDKTSDKPGQPNKENPNSPEGSKEDSKKGDEKIEEKEENKQNVSDELSKKRKDRGDVLSRKSTNPKTGIGSVAPILTSMGLSIVGLLATKKKKKEDQ